jgi:hypothetical protein
MRSFIGFGQFPYIGIPQSQPIKLSGIAGQAIPLLFQWISYGAAAQPNINVLVDISQQPCVKLDQIRSVYIDNLGSENPIYVNFPDTNYTVVAKPNSEGWYPAYTNARQCWIIGEGFLTSSIPQTFIILSNIFIPPAVNVEIEQAITQWKASAIITRGSSIYNTNYGTPALGDQVTTPALQCPPGAGNQIPNLFGTPGTSGFVYLTAVSVHAMNFTNPGVFTATQLIESTGASGVLYNFNFSGAANAFYQDETLMELSGLQLKLDATQQWRIRQTSGVIQSGYFQYYLHYTTNPT